MGIFVFIHSSSEKLPYHAWVVAFPCPSSESTQLWALSPLVTSDSSRLFEKRLFCGECSKGPARGCGRWRLLKIKSSTQIMVNTCFELVQQNVPHLPFERLRLVLIGESVVPFFNRFCRLGESHGCGPMACIIPRNLK